MVTPPDCSCYARISPLRQPRLRLAGNERGQQMNDDDGDEPQVS